MKIKTAGREFDTCFMTPTWRGDLDRFALLRESLVAFGHGAVPHYALINTEDVHLLEALKLPNVIPVPTRDLLSADVETRRLRYANSRGGRRWKTFKRSVNKRFPPLFSDARYYGWQIQQLIKLQAVVQLPHDVFICFDSDNVVTGKFSLEEFVPDGKVTLYEGTSKLAKGQKVWSWYGNARRLLKLPVPTDYERNYVGQPVVFEKRAMQALHRWLESHYRQPWYQPILAQPLGGWSEFNIYGVFVRDHLHMDGFVAVPANSNNLWIFSEEHRRTASEIIERAFSDPAIKLLVLQADHSGRWTVDRFLPLLRPHLAAVAASQNLLK